MFDLDSRLRFVFFARSAQLCAPLTLGPAAAFALWLVGAQVAT